MFRRVSGVYSSKVLILNDLNLSLFRYSYLLHRGFTALRFVFLEEGDQDETKDSFVEKLNATRRSVRLDPITQDQVKKKVRFVHLSEQQRATVGGSAIDGHPGWLRRPSRTTQSVVANLSEGRYR